MNKNEKLIVALTDEELMELAGGFIESSTSKSTIITLMYAIRPNPKLIIDLISNIIKK